MKRARWTSRLGFVLAVSGSAVGLANIWRFPYIAGSSGGSAFVFVYLICLLLIGFPVFVSEILIGRFTQKNPAGAFQLIGKNKLWNFGGKLTVVTGFIVSSFYSAIAGWILGYFFEALQGSLTCFDHCEEAASYFGELLSNPLWGVGYHLLFVAICTGILFLGVKKGIERGSIVMMPTLFVLLAALLYKALTLSGADAAISFLFRPDFSQLTPGVILLALGQAFFTLSLGQGTMVTYGSYLKSDDNIIRSTVPVLLVDTLVSLISGVIVFSILFSAQAEPGAGPGLIFHTLPVIFGQMQGGMIIATLFFLLVTLAAITSEISAMEPAIAYFIDQKRWSRKKATLVVSSGVALLGIPCALSSSFLSGWNILEIFDRVTATLLIPAGALLAVLLAGWKWGADQAVLELQEGAIPLFSRNPWIKRYFWFCLKYSSPLLIIVVFMNALGIFG